MITYVEGNLFESAARTLVNTVNTAGAMGKGIAKNFKLLFPDMFKEYQRLCEAGDLTVGRLWLFRTPNKWILNFPTKEHWRQPSRIEYVEKGLIYFVQNYNKARINSIAFPKLGCGNGELEWKDVKLLMEKHLKKLPIDVFVYIRNGNLIPEHKNAEEMRRWLMTEPSYYPFEELRRDIEGLLDKTEEFTDIYGDSFKGYDTDKGLLFINKGRELLLPWEGDESGKGLLEVWQFIRDKGISTIMDMTELGVACPKCIMGIFMRLPYIKEIQIVGGQAERALQLYSAGNQILLFRDGMEISTESI